MKLEKFRITNYRSIRDSGWVEAGQRTVLVGRNESGKSNLLLALRTLNSSEKLEPLSVIRDFPADLPRSAFKEDTGVVRTVWNFSKEECAELTRVFPRARNVTRVEVGRGYQSECWVRFKGLADEAPAEAGAAKPAAPSVLPVHATPQRVPLQVPYGPRPNYDDTAQPGSPILGGMVDIPGPSGAPEPAAEAAPTDPAADFLAQLAGGAAEDPQDDGSPDMEGVDGEKAARDWVLQRLPTFTYLDDYPDINGHQNLSEFSKRRNEKTPHPGDEYFEKLLIAAEIDPDGIEQLLGADPDTRRQSVNRAGGVITHKLRQLWTDWPLKVRFDLDGDHFHTLVSDPNSIYDVEINLAARSRGFRWFFSFYVSFAADAKVGSTANSVLLLDEPGLHLHPLGQRDLLTHLASDFDNQVLITTQSPFMVPADDLGAVRSVSISEESGTTVYNVPFGDEKTVFPIVHSIGAEISRRLLQEELSLVVEEASDLWYLRGVSNLVRERGGVGLPSQLSIFPAGGSTELLYMTSLLSMRKMRAIILRTEHPCPDILKDPIGAQLVPGANVVFIGDPTSETPSNSADIEDLLDPRVYDQLVRNAYKAQLEGRTLEPDTTKRRLVHRYDDALSRAGLVFSRERVARVFMRAMSQNPDAVLPDDSRDRFERLFRAIRTKFDTFRA